MMPKNDDANHRSPWYEAFAPAQRLPLAGWVEAPRQESQVAPAPAEDTDDASVTEAIFDYYNS